MYETACDPMSRIGEKPVNAAFCMTENAFESCSAHQKTAEKLSLYGGFCGLAMYEV